MDFAFLSFGELVCEESSRLEAGEEKYLGF
jgi:hypothetical protein